MSRAEGLRRIGQPPDRGRRHRTAADHTGTAADRTGPPSPAPEPTYAPAVEPEEFDACPVLLTPPAEDRWSPLHLSTPLLSRITRVPVGTVLLDGAGHYPLEEPGLTQMQDAIAGFVTRHTA
ncbi:hypothetical protein [Streptomyces sp. NPDC014733]|uniref:hypothetical protein n=1 Tax=Streptomyces sp. NPDC014733 TaxID=3364885 RepID=UPI0036F8A2F6